MAGGRCTGLQSRPPAFLDIPSGPWPRCSASCRLLRPRCTCLWDAACPPEFPGAPHTLAPDNFIGINSSVCVSPSRVLERGTFHSTGMSRFIARPGPVPLQSHHGNGFFYVARPSSGLHDPRVSLHARIAPLPLFGSMLSETPGARQSLSFAWTDAWLARRSIRSAGTQTVPFSGLCVRCRASTLHLAERPLPQQRFRAVGSTLPGKASVMRRSLAYFPSQ